MLQQIIVEYHSQKESEYNSPRANPAQQQKEQYKAQRYEGITFSFFSS